MNVFTEEELELAADICRSARQIRADLKKSDSKTRRSVILDEIEKRVQSPSREERKRKLQAVLCRLPVGGELARLRPASAAPTKPVPAPPPPSPPPPLGPEELLTRLVEVAGAMNREQKIALARRLADALQVSLQPPQQPATSNADVVLQSSGALKTPAAISPQVAGVFKAPDD